MSNSTCLAGRSNTFSALSSPNLMTKLNFSTCRRLSSDAFDSKLAEDIRETQKLHAKVVSASQEESDRRKQRREQETRKLWKKADAVCFDVDSTVCQDEGIDQLGKFFNIGQEVAMCTDLAMSGSMPFRESMSLQLNLFRPSKDQMTQFVNSHPIQLTPGIAELIQELHRRKVDVYLVTGQYSGFDESEPTSCSGGKAKVCEQLRKKYDYKTIVMVGDGATDAEACPPADAFIGFGGNQVREPVRLLADWYVYDFKTLLEELL
uniref:Phosphoserine phosphatase n=1 Tax=Ditylenchus dipsaci TaxID=166011 RepID=A0A915EF63_9BILA